MINKTYYNNGRRHAYLYPVDEVRYKEPEDLYIFFSNYKEYKERIKYIKAVAANTISFLKSRPKEKYTIEEALFVNNKSSISFGLCWNTESNLKKNKHYGAFDNARFKCPLMRSYIKEMNQEELSRFIDLQNITGCNNEKMCSIYNRMPNSNNIYNRIIDKNDQHDFVIEVLNYLKNYTIKT